MIGHKGHEEHRVISHKGHEGHKGGDHKNPLVHAKTSFFFVIFVFFVANVSVSFVARPRFA